MKQMIIICVMLLAGICSRAQFTKATLQASGLTCAMCTKAINNALEKLPYVESVSPDIANSAFAITFKKGADVDIDGLKKSVEAAGFSVAHLAMTANFNNVAVQNDEMVTVNGKVYHFLNIKKQVLSGEKEIVIVDKNFLPAKAFKKMSSATEMTCVQTGRAAGCCSKSGLAVNTRIYHVTI